MTKISGSAISVAMCLSLAMVRAVDAAPVLGPIYDPNSNTDLYVLPQGTWTQNEAAAQLLGGSLVTISSVTDNQFIVNNVLHNFTGVGGPNLSNVPLWIGLHDPTGALVDDGPGGAGSTHAMNFVWVDGSSSAYRNWNTATNEPTDSNPGEYFGTINWHFAQSGGPIGTWNDTPLNGTVGYGGNSDGPYFGIAAVPVPEPATIALLGSAFFVIAGMRFLQGQRRRR